MHPGNQPVVVPSDVPIQFQLVLDALEVIPLRVMSLLTLDLSLFTDVFTQCPQLSSDYGL